MLEKKVELPEGIEISQQGTVLTVKGPKGESGRDFASPKIDVKLSGNIVTFSSSEDRKKNYAILGTNAAHVRNMIQGVTTGWESKLKVVYSHFPIKVGVEGKDFVIQNFMGERSARKANILGDTKVDVKKDEVIVSGTEKEQVGQTAANIEKVTKVTRFDRRVFQDGIYITQKCTPLEGKG